MKKILCHLLPVTCYLLALPAFAGYDDARVRSEIRDGLDVRVAHVIGDAPGGADAPGQLGYEVYRTSGSMDTGDNLLFVPDKFLYVRAGGNWNIGSLSGDAHVGETAVKSDGGFGGHFGFGWNASSYVRLELDANYSKYTFAGAANGATMQSLGGTLYFDLARRWVRSGDITIRRTFVPYMGLGVRGGRYEFSGNGGASGNYIAPAGIFGLNFMLTDSIGIDVAYRWQMFAGKYGWNADSDSAGLSDVMASVRFNF
jgi:opacity protein-like surface antigen